MIAANGSLDDLVSALGCQSFDALDVHDRVAGLLSECRVGATELAPFVNFVAARYTRNLVYRCERFELLIVCWDERSASPIHDHGASRCFVKVMHGQLTVDDYTLVAGGSAPGYAELAEAGSQILTAGAIDVRNPRRDIHRVTPADGPAISLHVYAPPLDHCWIFDRDARSCRMTDNRYDTRRATLA